ncbi:hypothetical protein [Protofrankia coriariae]|uniref:Uncharacterized protein n=1 Tax=Protofrankia coriariae TaxID=1562887 RepID=A0ABR5F716_9ACTN|nr:hypothetical protein [Protofrankia coriariae]KLL12463.1 hypothetical protein FrCorBMG51_03990 [Protofrankia coriariae]
MNEAFGEIRALHLVIHDPEAGEDGLVELSAYVRRSAEVQPMRVGAEQQSSLVRLLCCRFTGSAMACSRMAAMRVSVSWMRDQ